MTAKRRRLQYLCEDTEDLFKLYEKNLHNFPVLVYA